MFLYDTVHVGFSSTVMEFAKGNDYWKRLELQKRLMNESEERLSYKVCRIIAKDLNLSVQQVCVWSHLDYFVGDLF